MDEGQRFLALDLGAESGRGEVVTLLDGKVTMVEVLRFPNRQVPMAGTLYWDFPGLFASVLETLRVCGGAQVRLSGIGVDTWGVDFGLLGRDDLLLGNPVCYRDRRTDNILRLARQTMPSKRIFDLTALHTLPINTLYQLLAMQRDKSPFLRAARSLLMVPDLINFLLTGRKVSELSIAQTSQLVGTDCRWSREIISAFGLPKRLFGQLVQPGTILGPLTDDLCARTQIDPGVPVIATAGHDTSSAVAAVPGQGGNWAFLSCGTWSILGCLVDEPVRSRKCHAKGFTNEYTLGGWYLGRNIIGLWMLQQIRKKWDRQGDPWDYPRMTTAAAAASADWSGLFDASDPSLLAPADMEEAILLLLRKADQARPDDRGQLVRCVLESLALEYSWTLDVVGELTGRRFDRERLTAERPDDLYMVGGGVANELLCQMTANACGVPVYAGIPQCTALGNALIQAVAVGALKDHHEVRQVARDSFQFKTFEPGLRSLWARKREQYAKIRGS